MPSRRGILQEYALPLLIPVSLKRFVNSKVQVIEYIHPQVASSWEVFSILVEADGHHPIGGVERFFNAIPMMAVYVDV